MLNKCKGKGEVGKDTSAKKMQTMGNNKQECERRGVRRMKSIAGGIGTSTNTWQHTTKHFVL